MKQSDFTPDCSPNYILAAPYRGCVKDGMGFGVERGQQSHAISLLIVPNVSGRVRIYENDDDDDDDADADAVDYDNDDSFSFLTILFSFVLWQGRVAIGGGN